MEYRITTEGVVVKRYDKGVGTKPDNDTFKNGDLLVEAITANFEEGDTIVYDNETGTYIKQEATTTPPANGGSGGSTEDPTTPAGDGKNDPTNEPTNEPTNDPTNKGGSTPGDGSTNDPEPEPTELGNGEYRVRIPHARNGEPLAVGDIVELTQQEFEDLRFYFTR